jgi:hypothetical protein
MEIGTAMSTPTLTPTSAPMLTPALIQTTTSTSTPTFIGVGIADIFRILVVAFVKYKRTKYIILFLSAS